MCNAPLRGGGGLLLLGPVLFGGGCTAVAASLVCASSAAPTAPPVASAGTSKAVLLPWTLGFWRLEGPRRAGSGGPVPGPCSEIRGHPISAQPPHAPALSGGTERRAPQNRR